MPLETGLAEASKRYGEAKRGIKEVTAKSGRGVPRDKRRSGLTRALKPLEKKGRGTRPTSRVLANCVYQTSSRELYGGGVFIGVLGTTYEITKQR